MHRKLIRTRVDANSLRVREAVLTVLAAGCTCLWASPALGASGEITLNAVKDNTIYSDTVSEGEGLSNGAGASIYAGRTFQDGIRRGLVAFDLSGIDLPGGAVITGAVLNLDITRDPPGAMATDLALHRLTADWGEGVSDAGDPGGSGAPAEAGDATWKHRFFDSAVWAMDGGDFLADPSATATADGMGTISWEGEGVLADVAHWLAQPAENFGWIVVGNESSAGNARRFASRENETTAIRPRLRLIWITPETIHSADADADGVIGLSELLRVIQFFNSGRFHCQSGTEDGYAVGAGDETCTNHSSDYSPQDWMISLSELLRLIQFFNSGGYSPCEGGEDGFCVSSGAKEGP